MQNPNFSLPLQPQIKSNGVIAQLVEQRTENPCVPGSIPGGTTFQKQSECSAVGSALRSGRRGRAFESPHSDRRAADDSISFAALSYYSSVINNFVIILCGMRLFISLQPKTDERWRGD